MDPQAPLSPQPASTEHRPYVSPQTVMPEFTLRALLVGAALGIVFGASSLYLVLKVGMTVSASIPVAVLAITLFRAVSRMFGMRSTTVLENNIVQTAGSAGESIAFGVGVTMPGIMLLGFDMELTRVMIVSLLGGLLGILMMIPLRRAFIVRLHGRAGEPGKLLYPEGTACAQVLITGDKGGAGGGTVFIGFTLAFLHKIVTEGMNVLKLSYERVVPGFNRATNVSADFQSELLGVGYIIGPRTASIMMAGAVMGWMIVVPLIFEFGQHLTAPLAPATVLIKDMSLGQMRSNYMYFIGAGCVAAAGIISMFRTMPMIVRSLAGGLANLGGGRRGGGETPRTERDLSMLFVFGGSLLLLMLLALFLQSELGWTSALLGAGLVLLFGFLFVTVSSRLTGEIGSTSNPISGMTIATLLLTALIFLTMKMTSPVERVLALSIAGVVCIAASNGGTTSQDLKTGFLVGATPRLQQWAIIIGALTSALVIGGTLLLFNSAGTVYSQKDLPTVNLKEQLPALTETMSHEGATYHVWRPTAEANPGVVPGKYLVDDAGAVRYLVDPAITGRLTKRDDGSDVKMKFDAPKTQVMGVILNGVLGGTMNWALVLMGALIAVVLELCGLSALPFAVGVYVPMGVTTPIFLGGLVRWTVEKVGAARKRHAPAASLAESESSPGVLLASGYIAGGTLAGVVLAFLEFGPTLKKALDYSTSVAGTFLVQETTAWAVFAGLMLLMLVWGMRRSTTPPAPQPAFPADPRGQRPQ